jgi:hypothetical protein
MTVWRKHENHSDAHWHHRAGDGTALDGAGLRLQPLACLELHDQPDQMDLLRRRIGSCRRNPDRHRPALTAGTAPQRVRAAASVTIL